MSPEQKQNIQSSYEQLDKRIRQASDNAGRSQEQIRLIAVSKRHSAKQVRAAYQAGLKDFGENYAQELSQKQAELHDLPLRWVFLGQLQSNKIKRLVRDADEIMSIASFRHACLIDQYVRESGKSPFPVWICVNSASEKNKGGVSFEEAPQLAERIRAELENLDLMGVMAIPPHELSAASSAREVPELYRRLRKLADSTGRGLLSLGMSKDLEAAICAGSDVIRIGRDLFGERPD